MKKLLALVMAAAMVLALVPMTALADATVTTETELQNACATGGTVTLGGEISMTKTIKLTSGQNVTLDLNGHKLIGPDGGSSDWYAFIVETGATLTLTDSSAAKTGVLWAKCYGVETKGGTFIMNGGKIDATNNTTYGCPVVNYGGKVTINGGTLIGDESAINAQAYFTTEAVVEINGGTLSFNDIVAPKNDVADDSAAVVIGGEYNKGSVEATISGGSIAGKDALLVDISEGDTAVEITGGSFSSDVSDYVKEGLEIVQGADGSYTVSLSGAAAPEAIPETGDGMGLFVFAGLALISMLGMVVMKKREQN